MTEQRRSRNRAGLGLPELGLVLVGIAVLSMVAMTQVNKRNLQQKRDITIQRLTTLQDALSRYAVDNGGMFPTAGQGGLKALLKAPTTAPVPPNWRGPYLNSADTLVDGWGVEFHYSRTGGGTPPRPYDVWSFGRDGRQEGEGPDRDINSYDRKTQLP